MIKLLLFGKQLLLFIIIAWSLLTFVSYNVLTVEATIEEKDISKMKFVDDDLDDYGLKEIAIEQECKDNGGQWKDDAWCKFDKIGGNDEIKFEHQLEDRGLMYYYADKEALGDEWGKYQNEKYEKSQKGVEEYEKYVAEQEEKAAKEDALCDNEDADSTNVKGCMSVKREQQMENIEKACDKVNGKMTKDGCNTDGSGDTPKADRFNDELMKLEEETGYPSIKEEVIEDYGNTVTNDDEDVKKAIKERAQDVAESEPWTNYPIEQKPVEEEEEIAESQEQVESPNNEETQESDESLEADEQIEEEQDEPEEEEDEPEEAEEDNSDSESEE